METTRKRGDTLVVPLSKLIPTEKLGYLRHSSESELENALADIEFEFEFGNLRPLDVIFDSASGDFLIADGHHRYFVASDWEMSDYPVKIIHVQ